MGFAAASPTRGLWWDGNSLSNFQATAGYSDYMNGYKAAYDAYASLIASGKKISLFPKGVGGKDLTELTADYTTKIQPYIRSNDILIIWEIVNEVVHNPTYTSQDVYNALVTYCNQAKTNSGVYMVVMAGIASNVTGDPPDVWTKVSGVNDLIRADHSFCDLFIDVSQIPQFNTVAGCSNGTYYVPDLIHLQDAGYLLIGNYVANVLVNYI